VIKRLLGEWSSTSWVTMQTAFTQAFGFLLFAIQAPLLGPRPFGLMAIIMIFAGFVELVLGECATETLISIPRAEPGHFATMTSLCAVVSILFGVGMYAVAVPIAKWFAEPELAAVGRCMTILPLLSIISAPANAACKREMQFRPLAIRTIVSLVAGGIVGLSLTFLNYGVWALTWQVIAQKCMATIILWRAAPLPFRFGLSLRHARDFTALVMPLFVSRCMSWASGSVSRFILGSFLGMGDLGIISLATRLSDIAIQVLVVPRYAVARVALRQYAKNRAGLDGAVHQLVFRYALLSFPACLGCAAIMPTLFQTWLDARWYPGIVPAQLLVLMCVPYVTIYTIGALLMAHNEQRAEAWLETAQTCAAILAVLIAAPFGLTVSAASIAGRAFVLLPLPLLTARKRCGVSAMQVLKPQISLLVPAVVMGAIVTVIQSALRPYVRGLILLPALIAAGAVLYGALLAVEYPQLVASYIRRKRT
jgi:O-antigen/teichoic acid export membrane protein